MPPLENANENSRGVTAQRLPARWRVGGVAPMATLEIAQGAQGRPLLRALHLRQPQRL